MDEKNQILERISALIVRGNNLLRLADECGCFYHSNAVAYHTWKNDSDLAMDTLLPNGHSFKQKAEGILQREEISCPTFPNSTIFCWITHIIQKRT